MIARIAAFFTLLYILGFPLFVVTLPTPAGVEVTDAVVVLTGSPGRIEHGIALLGAGRAKRMLISGVDRRVQPPELLAEYDVPAALAGRIDLGREANDTRSNGEETAQWIRGRRIRSIRLVTTDWHMPRALFEIRRTLEPEVTVLPDPVPSEPGLFVLATEYNKYLIRRTAALIGI
jgi:uncharacterized SAM-binding protein YcdF (DUF218 family)